MRKEKEILLQVNRLLPLTSHCALLTAGAAEGIEMGNALKQFIQGEGLKDVQDLYGAALAFLSTEYERFMRKKCELLPIDPIHQVSFILAGKTEKDSAMPFRLYFLWTKKKLPQLDGDEISFAFSLPRRMGLEFQLNKICKEKGPLREILEKVNGRNGAIERTGGGSSSHHLWHDHPGRISIRQSLKKTAHIFSEDGMVVSSFKNAKSPSLAVLKRRFFHPFPDIEIVLGLEQASPVLFMPVKSR